MSIIPETYNREMTGLEEKGFVSLCGLSMVLLVMGIFFCADPVSTAMLICGIVFLIISFALLCGMLLYYQCCLRREVVWV